MKDIFAFRYMGERFQGFSSTHITTVIILVVLNIIIITYLKKKNDNRINKCFRWVFIILFAFFEIFYYIWSGIGGIWTAKYSLPLDICGMAMIFCTVILINKNYFLYEITYFWALAGTIQAIVTPNLFQSFPHFIFIRYFIVHGSIITVILYFTIVEGFRPVKSSIWKTILFTNLYMLVIGIFNIIVDANYMFICRKPSTPSVIDFLGPWPWYILGLEIIGIISILICYLPFLIKDLFTQNKNTGAGGITLS